MVESIEEKKYSDVTIVIFKLNGKILEHPISFTIPTRFYSTRFEK